MIERAYWVLVSFGAFALGLGLLLAGRWLVTVAWRIFQVARARKQVEISRREYWKSVHQYDRTK